MRDFVCPPPFIRIPLTISHRCGIVGLRLSFNNCLIEQSRDKWEGIQDPKVSYHLDLIKSFIACYFAPCLLSWKQEVLLIVHVLFMVSSYILFCSVWSAAVHALTAFIECFISPNVVNDGVLLQPVLVYLNRYSSL